MPFLLQDPGPYKTVYLLKAIDQNKRQFIRGLLFQRLFQLCSIWRESVPLPSRKKKRTRKVQVNEAYYTFLLSRFQ